MVYLDGQYLPLADAKVSVLDRGFLFGDGIYEVIPVYGRRPFRLAEHLARLDASLTGIRMVNPHSAEQWAERIAGLIERHDEDNQSIYLQVTRGPMAIRRHVFPDVVKPTVFMMSEPLPTPSAEQRQQGVAAVSAADFRWLRCDLKATSLLANCLLRQLAVDAGCLETILFRDGFLTEGAASSIFVVQSGRVLVPPKSNLMLPGITYDVVLELATAHGLPVELRAVSEAEVRQADELWLASSTKEVLPIVRLDGAAVGSGKPGPVFANMHAWYQDFKREVMGG